MVDSINMKKIKLIIWDLDDTFWKGTFSEEKVTIINKNIDLVIDLNKRGIVSSICSKNNEEDVLSFLDEIGVSDQFVFKSINWEAKAPRIKSIIEKMNLRQENVLFIDDNIRNLGEAKYLLPQIMTALPDIVDELIRNCSLLGKDDSKFERLNQYRLLEKKTEEKEKYYSEKDFLKDSFIEVTIRHDINSSIDRICELNERAHQLNYTKKDLSPEQLKDIINNNDIECGIIKCRDKYGEYGDIGFYMLDKGKHKLIHYFFSCRTLGMHVEQFIYQLLNYPTIDIIPPVTIDLEDCSDIDYIHVSDKSFEETNEHNKAKVLIVGPCDLEAVDFFLPWNSMTEFRHFDNKKRLIGYGSHPLILNNVLNKIEYSKTPFFNDIVKETEIFSGKYELIVYSFLTALLYGEYEKKDTKERIVFGEWPYDATSEDYDWNNSIGFDVDKSEQNVFQRDYKYVGRVEPELQAKRIISIIDKVLDSGCKVCLLLASEIPYNANTQPTFKDADIYAKLVNEKLIKYYENKKNVSLVNPSNYIHSQKDYVGCIQHYSRNVYKAIADAICKKYPNVKNERISKAVPELLRHNSKTNFMRKIKRQVKRLFKK